MGFIGFRSLGLRLVMLGLEGPGVSGFRVETVSNWGSGVVKPDPLTLYGFRGLRIWVL